MQASTPDAVLGRVSAVFHTSDAVATVLGGLAGPVVLALAGPGPAMTALCAAVLAAAAIAAAVLPAAGTDDPAGPA
jgi:hypothetical protein